MPEIFETSNNDSREMISNEVKEKEEKKETTEETITPQEVAEQTHVQTKESMVEQYGEYMTYDRIKEIESPETLKSLKVVAPETYHETFPNMSYGVMGHCDSEGNIFVKESSDADVKHITTHETMHLVSEKDLRVESDGIVLVSGLRESKVKDRVLVSDLDLAANEGTTEMYTLRELSKQGEDEAMHSISAYSESRMWMERMEGLVGEEKLAGAYFGGRKAELQAEFNRLNNNDETAWRKFSKDIDILEYGNDPEECQAARIRLALRYNDMMKVRYGLED